MGIFDSENEVMDPEFDQKLLEKICREFKIDHKNHLKPGQDVLGNKISKGDIVLVISPSSITKTRLIPAIVVKHTKVKTQVISAFSHTRGKWDRDENGRLVQIGEKTKHASFYPEQIIKIDIDTAIKVKEAINKKD